MRIDLYHIVIAIAAACASQVALAQQNSSKVEPSPRAALPLVTLDRNVTSHMNGDVFDALHCPAASTDGDAIVHFKRADAFHMGNSHFNFVCPLVDASGGAPSFTAPLTGFVQDGSHVLAAGS